MFSRTRHIFVRKHLNFRNTSPIGPPYTTSTAQNIYLFNICAVVEKIIKKWLPATLPATVAQPKMSYLLFASGRVNHVVVNSG